MTARPLLVSALLAIACAAPAGAYLPLAANVGGEVMTVRWPDGPVRWYASDEGIPNVAPAMFQAAVARAFDTWERVPTAAVSFSFAGFTSAAPFDEDGLTVLGFEAEPDLDRVLGATSFVVDEISGEVVEADIFFNSIFAWSAADAGDANRFDLQAVATHEIGHLLGLGHSALGETELRPSGGRRVLASGAVMFPVAFGPATVADRVLQPDDIAGVSSIYPAGGFRAHTGAVRGRVLLNGTPVFGAHVVAMHLESGDLVAGFTLNDDGEFQITGLRPGPHVIRVEPLDDADVEGFFDVERVEIGFGPSYYPRLVVVPSGGTAPRFDVVVTPK